MRFYMLTLGCPKNDVDAEGMSVLLRQRGFEAVERPEEADIVIVNTCGFIEEARRESLAALRRLAKGKHKGQLLIAAGCLSQLWGGELARHIPELDGILGTRRWAEIPDLLERLRAGQNGPLILVGDSPRRAMDFARAPKGASAYLKIAEGCDASCAFCTIPRIKGPFHSRPREVILEEARRLVAQGVKEVILIAQDTTAYGKDWGQRDALSDLLEDILKAVPGLRWLRLMYAHPAHVTPRLIETMARHPQICHYLDLPLQHAHPAVLKRMRRPASMGKVRRLIESLRQAMPDIAIRTVFIVGYPGETEEEFETLLDFVREMAFERVGVFKYSREEGTPAARLPGQVPEEIKEERYRRLMELQQDISWTQNQALVGSTLDVLVEGRGSGWSVGRSYRDAPEIDGLVLVKGDLPIGEMVPVRITEALEYDLLGTPQP